MNRRITFIVLGVLCGLFFAGGCFVADTVEFFTPRKSPSYNELWQDYNSVELGHINAAEVLEAIYLPEFELLSQSRSVIATVGENKRGYKSWFKLVAFDEESLTAQRKYFFVVDEKPKQLFVTPWTFVRYDCEMVVDKSLSAKPYSDDNARLIELLQWMLEKTRDDIDEVARDNKTLAVDGSMLNQAMEEVITKLEHSPANATRLGEKEGLLFDHISLNRGKIQLLEKNGKVSLRMVIGSNVKQFKLSFERFEDSNEPPLK